ncbi:MAG: LamG-like jellyroll fold domain-containing protein, partial [Verrucomicrobiota bacterium]
MNTTLSSQKGFFRPQEKYQLRHWLCRFMWCAGLLLARGVQGQSTATLIDLGTVAPAPGSYDVSQLSTNGNVLHPDGLNYFTDNQTGYNSGEPGQTFTTGINPSGYTLTSIGFLSAGLGDNSGIGTPQPYYLHLYSVSGGSATPVQTNISANFTFSDGDWLEWSNLSLALSPNTTYAYSFGKASGTAGWEGLAADAYNPYEGGEIALIPPGGGAITYGGSHAFDAVFDVGLAVPYAVATTTPAVFPTNSPVYAGPLETLTVVAGGETPLYYQWQTDGGGGGTRTNVPGATLTNLTVNTSELSPGMYKFDVVVTNASGAATSAVVALQVVAASPPLLVSGTSPASAQCHVGDQQTFSALFKGTLPITYQWQVNTGGGATNIPGATNSSLTLTDLQVNNAGSYSLLALNSLGGPVASSSATLNVANIPFVGAMLAAQPVAYWRLNETGSTASGTLIAADALNRFNGVYGSSATDGIGGPTPLLGFPGFEASNTGAGVVNGVANSFITVPALNLNTNAITITAWIYPIGTPANYCGLVFCRPGGDASGLNFTSGGQLGYTWNQNNQNTWSWLSGLVPPLQQWSFVALVISPQNAIIYLCNTNGIQSATNEVASSAEAFNATSLIGDDSADGGNGGRDFNGSMDEVAVFNYSLAADQVLDLYFGAAGGAPEAGQPQASPASTVFAGTTVTLSSTVVGQPPFQYQWLSNQVDIVGATNSSLVLTDVTVADSAGYSVIASNGSGTNESPALNLTVNPASAPIFTQQPSPT